MKSYTVMANGIRQFVVEEVKAHRLFSCMVFLKQTMPGATRYPYCPGTTA